MAPEVAPTSPSATTMSGAAVTSGGESSLSNVIPEAPILANEKL